MKLFSRNTLNVIVLIPVAMANNSKCVFIRAKATTAGVQLSAPAPGGVQIKFSD